MRFSKQCRAIIIRDVKQVAVGDEVIARLTNGQVRCTVNDVTSNPSV
ncbi:MAG: hypothetical protein U0236_04630 [Nitrospira sp.]